MGELKNKGSVEVAKAHEGSYLFDGCRSWPVCYSLDFDRVHVHYPLLKD